MSATLPHLRHPRESGGPASSEEQRDSRFRGNDGAVATPRQIWIGLPVTAIAASLTASLWVGWAWQV
ncbi:MAG: hypothetical protein E6G92_00160 [Alphaproteobacteria bacterium]|nr:MAG: hypothetical protein E6G92_00160 [Alphaproteobacteria bacterium]